MLKETHLFFVLGWHPSKSAVELKVFSGGQFVVQGIKLGAVANAVLDLLDVLQHTDHRHHMVRSLWSEQ